MASASCVSAKAMQQSVIAPVAPTILSHFDNSFTGGPPLEDFGMLLKLRTATLIRLARRET